jgi:hypothetical protein
MKICDIMTKYISSEKLEQILIEIYREMYRKSIPSADFDEMMDKGETKQSNFYLKYYLPEQDQIKIVNIVCDKYNLDTFSRKQLSTEVWLGCSPTASREAWERERGVRNK